MNVQHVRRNLSLAWSALFLLWAAQGAFFLWQFMALPSDREEGLLFGYSAFRLLGILLLVIWIVLALVLAGLSRKDPAWRERWLDSILTTAAGDFWLVSALFAAVIGQAILAVLWGLSQQGTVFSYAAYAARLAPLLNLLTLTGLELTGWIILNRWHAHPPAVEAGKALLRRTLPVWAALGALAVFVAVTGLGIVPDNTGEWGLPAVALLEWQIVLACGLCALTLILEARSKVGETRYLDLWISLGLWFGILALWLSQPVNPGFFALAPRAPNFEIYPFTDLQVYDEFAQSLLIGNGLKGNEIPPRPLYIAFLAFLHSMVGQEYSRVIAAQSVFLALFPVALYWAGKELYGRPVGIAVALLAGLRDLTSNVAAPFTSGVTYSKLYLSEVPVALMLALFTFLAVRWARSKYPGFQAFVAGGVLGVGILIRTQAIVALPALVLVALVADRKNAGSILRGALLMSLAIALAVTPWLARNYFVTGQLIFDSPFTQTINLAQRYSRMNGVEADAIRRPGETNIEYNDRLIAIFREAVSRNPQEAVRVVINRFLNNGVNNVLLLPLRNDLTGLDELWRPTRAFWEEWNGNPTPSQVGVLAFYLFLLGLGIGAAWKRLGLLGLAPLFINLVYNLWTSLALLAGQRFMVAMDWSIYTYYMIGLFVLIGGFLLLLERTRPLVVRWAEAFNQSGAPTLEAAQRPRSHFLLAGLAVVLIGASIPLSERLYPKKYPPLTQARLFDEFTASTAFERSGIEPACLAEAVAEHHLTAFDGRALSPRYYEAGDGEFTDKLGYRPSDESRLLFYMTGNRYGLIILEMDTTPEFFPHASDVTVYLGEAEEQRAWLVLVRNEKQERLYLSEFARQDIPCLGNP